MKKSLYLLFIIMGIIGCAQKVDIPLSNGSSLSKEEARQKDYEKKKNEKFNSLDSKIKKFDKKNREDLKSMGTISQ